MRKKLTGNDIYEIAYNEGNGWAGKGTIQLDVTNIPDYATLSLDSFKYVALLSSSGTGGATEEITGSYMGVKVLGYDSGSGKLSIQTANAYRPIFIVVIEISIHLMFLLIVPTNPPVRSTLRFQYISCFY